MSGLFNTLNTANKGLNAQQTALHTTGHNISNTNTRGYSRQRVNLQADLAFNYVGVGQLGTGVRMTSIERIVNQYVNNQIMVENSTFNQYEVRSEVSGQLEVIFNEPSDTGINFDLGQVFDAWSELSKNPESGTARTVVVEKTKTLVDNINHTNTQIDKLEDSILKDLENEVNYVNDNLEKLDKLNEQIFYVSIRGQSPNDLLDQRDLLLKDLSDRMDVDFKFDTYGRVNVNMGNNRLLMDTGLNGKLSYEEPGDGEEISIKFLETPVKDKDGNLPQPKEVDVTEFINSGSIRGNIDALAGLKESKSDFNKFVNVVAESMNEVHTQGAKDQIKIYEIDADTGIISINEKILENHDLLVAGAESNEIEGDGSRALAMNQLRNVKLKTDANGNLEKDFLKFEDDKFKFTSAVGGASIEDRYRNIVTGVGAIKQQANNMLDNQDVLLEQLEMRRESESGVSINEEISNVIKFQKSYEANARVIQTIAEMLDTLINRTGV